MPCTGRSWPADPGATLGIGANILAARPHAPGAVDRQDLDGNQIDDRLDWLAANVADPLGKSSCDSSSWS